MPTIWTIVRGTLASDPDSAVPADSNDVDGAEPMYAMWWASRSDAEIALCIAGLRADLVEWRLV